MNNKTQNLISSVLEENGEINKEIICEKQNKSTSMLFNEISYSFFIMINSSFPTQPSMPMKSNNDFDKIHKNAQNEDNLQ